MKDHHLTTGIFIPETNPNQIIEVSIIRYTNFVNYRRSGEGRNPALLFKMQSGFVPRCGVCWNNWIPAFAGMTRCGFRALS